MIIIKAAIIKGVPTTHQPLCLVISLNLCNSGREVLLIDVYLPHQHLLLSSLTEQGFAECWLQADVVLGAGGSLSESPES